jgi:hypothetical protein
VSADGRWRTRGAEGLTIVVSILLALLADAGWDYRKDRADERQLIEGLRAEFAHAATEIDNDIRSRSEILARTEALLEVRQDPVEPPPADSIQGIMFDLLNWRFYTPVHAVLEDALQSGRLELIRSDSVRVRLMAYMQARDRLPVFETLERDFVTQRLEPYLSSRVALDYVMDGSTDAAALKREGATLWALLADAEFGSLLYVRGDRSGQAQLYSEMVQREIAAVRRALEDQG